MKSGRVLPARLQTALAQARAAAKGTGKTPLVCIEHARKGNVGNLQVVMLSLADFVAWFGRATP